jgi:ribosomal protein L21
MKIAIIQTGGKQYLVIEGSHRDIEKIKNLNKEEGDSLQFEDILFFSDGEKIFLDKDELKKVKVEGILVKKKKLKTIFFKYKSKKIYRKNKCYNKEIFNIKI